MQRQLYAALRQRIASGQARAGASLPSSRGFAAELGVSRATVLAAYDQLQAEGYLETRPGAGVFVAVAPERALPAPQRPAGGEPPEIGPSPRAFRPGVPDMRLFPHEKWARAAAAAIRRTGQGFGEAAGSPALRQALAAHLAEWRGIAVAPSGLMITAGAAGALDLVFDAFTRPGDAVGLESPGYPVLWAMARQRGLRAQAISVDAAGLDVQGLGSMSPVPRLVVVTPTNQFPLGSALSAPRRAALLRWAAETGAIVVEDDYDSEFRFSGRPLPAMAAAAGEAQVIFVGTFSKVFSPALRIGYLAAPPALQPGLAAALARFGPRASMLPQEPLADFIASGEFARHLRRMRRIYAARRAHLLSLLSQTFAPGELTPLPRDAGMHLVLTFGGRLQDANDFEVAARAAEAGVTAEPLSRHYAEPPAQRGLLLGFAGFDEVEAQAGVEALARALADY